MNVKDPSYWIVLLFVVVVIGIYTGHYDDTNAFICLAMYSIHKRLDE